MIRLTSRPATLPASLVAWRWSSLKYAGTVITAESTDSPSYASASAFSLPRIIALISARAYCLSAASTRAAPPGVAHGRRLGDHRLARGGGHARRGRLKGASAKAERARAHPLQRTGPTFRPPRVAGAPSVTQEVDVELQLLAARGDCEHLVVHLLERSLGPEQREAGAHPGDVGLHVNVAHAERA